MLFGIIKYLCAASFVIIGEKGIQKSRFLIILLIFETILKSDGFPKIDLFPRALAPNSILPEHLATILCSANNFAVSNYNITLLEN